MIRKATGILETARTIAAGVPAGMVSNGIEDAMSVLNGAVDRVIQRTEELRDGFSRSAEDTADQTSRRAARLARSVVEFEKTTFDNAFKVMGRLMDTSSEAVTGLLYNASWMPREGKQVVREWTHLMQTSRKEFESAMGKSFDLLTEFLERVEEGNPTPAKKSAPRAGVKSSAAAKRPVVAKAVAKKATASASRSAAAKSTAAKPAAKAPAKAKAAAKPAAKAAAKPKVAAKPKAAVARKPAARKPAAKKTAAA